MQAIPTRYRGFQMRSRLEAKWAAFFDLLGWRWDYEPLDLNGWIPDFVIDGQPRPVLVEVKPLFGFSEEVACKIEKALNHQADSFEVLILGAGIAHNQYRQASVGWITDDFGCDIRPPWDCAVIIHPHQDETKHGLAAAIGSYRDRITGFHDGDHGYVPLTPDELVPLWASASNATQWKSPR